MEDEHHYIQKAVGWMLKEIGKRDKEILIDFLEKYHKKMPLLMLRYAMEKLSKEEIVEIYNKYIIPAIQIKQPIKILDKETKKYKLALNFINKIYIYITIYIKISLINFLINQQIFNR